MALVPIIQPPIMRLCTTEKERKIRMAPTTRKVSNLAKILFPIITAIIAAIIAPASAALIGFLMFGNLIRVCGVLDGLSHTAQNELSNLITILLGISIAARMTATDLCPHLNRSDNRSFESLMRTDESPNAELKLQLSSPGVKLTPRKVLFGVYKVLLF